MIPYSHQSIGDDDVEAVFGVFKSDWLTQGPEVREFEEALAKYTGAEYAVVFSNGTAALEAAYFAADLKKDDEVITTSLTFAATANAALWQGAKVVFADIEADSGNIDPNEVEKKITPKTKAIVPVDYSGLPVRLDELKALAEKHKLLLIEDAAHALGAEYLSTGSRQVKKVGSIADMTMLSFHPVKSIATGEGGAILTGRKDFYEKLLLYRGHGITKDNLTKKPEGDWYYEMQALAHNYRMTDIQAALGVSQLKKLDKFIEARKKIAVRYGEAFAGNKNLILPKEYEGASSSWHLYPLRLKDAGKRAEIFKKLRDAGIGVQVHYIPVYLHPYYQKLGYKAGLCPKAEVFYESEISIPIFPDLTEKDQDFVIQKVNELT
ncbi:UDP-4-amino-4,6-dideoxy-N-acetyl-beta-L-altrosamine transaminase [Candidatus Giovannonibacteria bacterium RIFCSPHIGHO2_01_FULL_45_33]|uniref:UDP-4-amino-4, 6-dideoxy-N-acetyl-beta-L-altrosamine transaminase n=1 Tax=Candidatus Giovannonibacteria bacterium RIFCSPLOWO2_01_FULL_45_34 TaxID=1798351 RepID=A0A1F5WYG1_9BACT|nr:MAG: UDP-4-amino-4,6-dideoxy-N-acetyl-beta-L-altrosamine transaminase [Candidatus Giovannonibacteria bacterium RIFCSPHIGHO2_01_FULL_45_33]OGF70976.1 MAG: UDP-4-amino-4,6-dideoxy-N-acetyl-beta-L-altrosamine transaminase [Candidatus Giovannonibacteria bacterium RIFCSPHIGHO2_02_FULL_44_11]OGF80695.1 MAG: UDP-4-amino-4,6-dideoxy-N-acetyl-beta-L-altrosamine transaminase [Candidatus Giovannonibacteria bacterium RIFCSPLOWO2_01_FULL_45_34]